MKKLEDFLNPKYFYEVGYNLIGNKQIKEAVIEWLKQHQERFDSNDRAKNVFSELLEELGDKTTK